VQRLVALFPSFPHSQLLNVGFDETYELGEGRSRPDVARHGRFAVYVGFLRAVAALARELNNATIQWWGDIDAEESHGGERPA
jgi:hypothetical protein